MSRMADETVVHSGYHTHVRLSFPRCGSFLFLLRVGVDEGGTGGPGAGMQERARRWRRAEARDILTKSITEAGGGGRGVIATAHHRDDQAETVLLKALRGAHITKMQARDERKV